MHHRRSSPPPSARLAAACGRVLRPLSRALAGRRALPVLVVVVAVAGIVLVVPLMAAGRGGLSTAESGVTSSAGSSAPRSGVVTMGVDGEPVAPGTTPAPGAPGTTAGGPSTGASPDAAPDAGPDASRASSPGSSTAGGPSTTEAAPDTTAPGTTAPDTTAPGTTAAGSSAPDTTAAGSPAAGSSSGSSTTALSAAASSAGSSSAGSSSAGSSSAGTSSAAPAPTQTSAQAVPAPAARTAAPAASGTEAAVLELVNQARAEAGCGAVSADPALAAVARAHSADMRDRGYFSHDTPEGLSPFDRAEAAGLTHARAENIAYGQRDAAAVMDSWMNSPGHRANILNCSLSTLGVGVAEGPGGPWWTQLFGA